MKKWLKFLTNGMVTMSAAVALTACSNKKVSKQYRSSLSWMTTSEIQTLDQSKMVDTTGDEQATNVFEGLNRVNNNGKIVSGVATSSKSSKDGLTWTFTLRKNARWSNGDPVTAQDFVYSMRRTMDPKTQSQQQNN